MRGISAGLTDLTTLKASGELGGKHMTELTGIEGLVLKTVLQLQLCVGSEAITERGINSPKIVAKCEVIPIPIRHRAKELLIPAQGAEELQPELVFAFEIVDNGIGVTDARNLKPDLVDFRPHLQVAPGETQILT